MKHFKRNVCTFAKWRWAVPLRGMAGDTADDDLTNKLVAFITEETQSFSCLVAVLVQGLVTVIRDAGVWTRVIFHCSKKTHIILQCFETCTKKQQQ